MPYIKQKDRKKLDAKIDALAAAVDPGHRAGELNYIFNRLVLALQGEGKYKDVNELMGALECAKLEFYRRKIAPFENKKASENGDLPWS